MSKLIRVFILAAGILLVSSFLFSQSNTQTPPQASISSAQPASVEKPAEGAPKADVRAESNRAPEEEEEENIQFKYSPFVRKVATATGLTKEAIYWIFLIINFVILAVALGWVVKKMLPNGFAPRTAEIQKGIEDARNASAEASARLSEIEGRLAKLDSEIAEVRTAAEADFSVEEQRIKAAAEELVRHLPTQNDKHAGLLPPLSEARRLGRAIGQAVGRQAIRDGQAQVADEAALSRELDANIWEPVYVPYERKQNTD